jgi:hypothetical protein
MMKLTKKTAVLGFGAIFLAAALSLLLFIAVNSGDKRPENDGGASRPSQPGSAFSSTEPASGDGASSDMAANTATELSTAPEPVLPDTAKTSSAAPAPTASSKEATRSSSKPPASSVAPLPSTTAPPASSAPGKKRRTNMEIYTELIPKAEAQGWALIYVEDPYIQFSKGNCEVQFKGGSTDKYYEEYATEAFMYMKRIDGATVKTWPVDTEFLFRIGSW